MNYNMNSNKEIPIKVRLIFPHINNLIYSLSLSAALNSEFLCTLLNNEEILENLKKNNYKIESTCFHISPYNGFYVIDYQMPFEFYNRLREVDMDWFMAMWNGTDQFHSTKYPKDKINGQQVANLSRVLLINQSLPFIKRLDSAYPPYVTNNTSNNSLPPYTVAPLIGEI